MTANTTAQAQDGGIAVDAGSLRAAACVLVASAAGWLAWGPMELGDMQLAAAAAVWLAWWCAPSRWAAGLAFVGYYATPLRDVPAALAEFASWSVLLSNAVVGLYAVAIAALWAVLRAQRPVLRATGFAMGVVITTLTPIGAFVGANPVLALSAFAPPSADAASVVALDTDWGKVELGDATSRVALLRLTLADVPRGVTVLLPEGLFHGDPTLLGGLSGELRARKVGAVVGVIHVDGDLTRNLLVGLGTASGQAQAMAPAPVGLWRPWAQPHAPLSAEGGDLRVNGAYVAAIICWEELVAWPWAVQALQAARGHGTQRTVLIGVNHWFARHDSSITPLQRRSGRAWARLLGWSTVRAINR